MPNILPIVSNLTKLYSNITAPPTTPPPSPPPPTQSAPGPETWSYPYPYPYPYPPFFGHDYGTWQSPPFGPPATYVMPPVWPWSGVPGYGMPGYIVVTSQPTATTTPASSTSDLSPLTRRKQIRVVGDEGSEERWAFYPDLAKDILRRYHSPGMIRPSPSELAMVIQGVPLNAAAYGKYRQYYEEFLKEMLFKNRDLRKELEVAKNPPKWYEELWGPETEWEKETRLRKIEMLPALIEKYQPEPLQRPASQSTQTQPPATQVQPPAPQTRILPLIPYSHVGGTPEGW